MLTASLLNILQPFEKESLDEYLYRATDTKEIRSRMLEAVQDELAHCTQTSLKRELQHMAKILIGAGKTHFLADDIDGNRYWGEVVYSRAAKYDKPRWLKQYEESNK
ncbi:hypothetical protein CN918_28000 [Priestia megaterium]|nr:hypothetical protein CN918_28000 [Priestia megaterium]